MKKQPCWSMFRSSWDKVERCERPKGHSGGHGPAKPVKEKKDRG